MTATYNSQDGSAVQTVMDIEEKRQINESPMLPHSNASSTGWHDEEKDRNGTRQNSDASDGHDPEAIESQSLAGSQLPPPPDGGLHAWLKVFGGFLVYINIWCGSFHQLVYASLIHFLGALHSLMAPFNLTTPSRYFLMNRRPRYHGSAPSKVGY